MAARGERPTEGQCVKCASPIDYLARHPSGRLKHTNAALCPSCRRERAKLAPFIPALIERDGPDCQICGRLVDLSLRFPNPMSRSVDHIIPWSKGGPSEMANYQLAHFGCNSRKQAREDFTLRTG